MKSDELQLHPTPSYDEVRTMVMKGIDSVYDSESLTNEYSAMVDDMLCKYVIDVNLLDPKRPFEQSNMMCQCRILGVGSGNRIDRRLPSLLMRGLESSPKVLFTTRGIMTVTGGRSKEEVCHRIVSYCHKVLFYLGGMYPVNKFTIGGYTVCNRVCSGGVQHRVYLEGLAAYFRMNGYWVKYEPDYINILYVYPAHLGKSVCISVAGTGGITILGFTHRLQASTAIMFILSHIKGFVSTTDIPPFIIGSSTPKSRTLAKRKRVVKEKGHDRKLTKKLKKMEVSRVSSSE